MYFIYKGGGGGGGGGIGGGGGGGGGISGGGGGGGGGGGWPWPWPRDETGLDTAQLDDLSSFVLPLLEGDERAVLLPNLDLN